MVRVGVSSTPGKTKHLQTLELSKTVMLCDCPGLVFPSFMNSTAEMICAGILPINQMRDYIEPARVIATRIPRHLLDAAYGMHIVRELDVADDPDRPPTPHEVLCAYCSVKGFVTNGTGRWDEFRACKDLLRDFTDGRILYVAPPFDGHLSNDQDMKVWLAETEQIMMKRTIVAERIASQLKGKQSSGSLKEDLRFDQFVFGNEIPVNKLDEVSLINSEIVDVKRVHKKLKHWGKKNKKLRDKTPYGENAGTESYVIHSTNRI